MGKLNFLGIGPRIALVLPPWLTLTIIFSILYVGRFNYVSDNSKFMTVAGIVLQKEYNELEKIFGEEYIKYKTPEFFPIPIKKWFK